MNKTQLIQSLSEETTFSKKDISRVLEAFTRILVRVLKKGDKLQWSGLVHSAQHVALHVWQKSSNRTKHENT